MIGQITKGTKVSIYQPSQEIADFTGLVKKDYQQGYDILQKPWTELNDRSIIEDQNRGQRMFNAFVDESVDDPNETWKYRGTRSMARNKGIAMHAQLTAAYLIPIFTAQNDNDEVDQTFSDFMRDVVEWMTYPENSDYQPAFLSIVFGMLENPVTYLGAEYCEVFQKVREKKEDGGYTTKEILDEVLSGFKAPVYSPSQVLITNAYERNIQKQRVIIKRRWVELTDLKAKYGDHENFSCVQPGVRALYNNSDGLFYEIYDDEHPNLVEETTWLNRRDDTEICFLNGIYMSEENLEANPIYHRDNRNAPKYNVIPFGYNRIGQHFFYYKSMMNVMGWDNALYDAMSEIVMNRAVLEQNMPVAISGVDKVDTEVIFPGARIASENENFRVTPIIPPANFVAGFQALRETEKSMDDASLSDVQMGQLPEASQKAYSVAQAAQAAKKIIGGVGKSLAESVTMYGDLMKDIAINHITVPQAEEIVGKGVRLKYRNFLLPKKNIGGKTVDKELKFSEEMLGNEMTDKEKDAKSLELLNEVDYPENKKHIYKVNPEMFSKFKYYAKVDLKQMFQMNEEMMSALLTNLYTMLRQDPMVNGEGLLRKLLYSYFQSDGEDLIVKQQNPMAQLLGGGGANEGKANPLGDMANKKALSTSLSGANVV